MESSKFVAIEFSHYKVHYSMLYLFSVAMHKHVHTVAAKSYGTILLVFKMAGLKSSIAIGLKSTFREWLRIITP